MGVTDTYIEPLITSTTSVVVEEARFANANSTRSLSHKIKIVCSLFSFFEKGVS